MFDLTDRDVNDHIEEYRRIVRGEEDRRRARDGESARPRLVNTQRMVKLHALFRNPYQEFAASGLSALDMMEVCARNLVEREDFEAAGKLYTELARYRHVRMPEMTTVRRLSAEDPLPPEHPAPEPPAPPPPPPPPPPEPIPPAEPLPELKLQPLRPQSVFDQFVDSLPARQRADMILLQEKEAARPPNGPKAEERFMSYRMQLQRDTAISGF